MLCPATASLPVSLSLFPVYRRLLFLVRSVCAKIVEKLGSGVSEREVSEREREHAHPMLSCLLSAFAVPSPPPRPSSRRCKMKFQSPTGMHILPHVTSFFFSFCLPTKFVHKKHLLSDSLFDFPSFRVHVHMELLNSARISPSLMPPPPPCLSMRVPCPPHMYLARTLPRRAAVLPRERPRPTDRARRSVGCCCPSLPLYRPENKNKTTAEAASSTFPLLLHRLLPPE